jgi:hypothetical protein
MRVIKGNFIEIDKIRRISSDQVAAINSGFEPGFFKLNRD